jgi:hypothetical protein
MFAPSEIERHVAAARAASLERSARHSADAPPPGRFRRRRGLAQAHGDAADAPIVLRQARDEDAPALADLAQLDGRPLPGGPQVVAESRGRLVAAAEIATGAAIADPFLPSAAAVALVRMRAAQLRPMRAGR